MAWVVGRLTERAARPSWLRAFVAMLAGIAALYLPGTAWLSLWLHSPAWRAAMPSPERSSSA